MSGITRFAFRILGAAALMLVMTAILAQERREIPEFRTYGEPVSKAQADAIDDLIRRYKTSWADQDTAALVGLHSADTEWINAYARIFQGAAPLAEFLEHRLFPAFNPAVSREEASNMQPVSIRYLGDVVVVHMYTDGARGASRNPGEELRRVHLHLVLHEQGNEWKIVHSAIMDAR